MSYYQVYLPLLHSFVHAGGGTSQRGAGEAVKYINDSCLPRPSTNVKGGVGTTQYPVFQKPSIILSVTTNSDWPT